MTVPLPCDVAQTLSGLTYFFPALNEEAHVAPLVERAREALAPVAERLEVIVVDDGSADATGRIADDLSARYRATVRVVHHGRRRGYGAALRSGIAAATQPYVFYTDGDRQFDPGDIALLLPHLARADAVVGYRAKRSDPLRRRFVGWVYNRVIELLFGLRIRDADCAFKLFRRDVFARVPLERVRSNGAFFSAELLVRLAEARVPIVQVAVPHHPRTWGQAKGAPPRVILRAIRDLLVLRWRLWRERPTAR